VEHFIKGTCPNLSVNREIISHNTGDSGPNIVEIVWLTHAGLGEYVYGVQAASAGDAIDMCAG
jgi:hypothetical protein